MSTLVRSTQRVSAASAAVARAASSTIAIVVRLMRRLLLGRFSCLLRVQYVLAAPVLGRRRDQIFLAARDHLLGRAVVGLRLQRGLELLESLVELPRPVRRQPRPVALPRFHAARRRRA